jgi:hypothetical protein
MQMTFLKIIASFFGLWCIIYLFVAMGNAGFMGSRDQSENSFGCTLMIFIPAVIWILLSALVG